MSPIPCLILDTRVETVAPGVRSHPACHRFRNAQKRFNAASTLATLVTDRKRTCGVRRLDNGRPQKWLAAFEYPEIFDCLSINDGERSASTRDHLRYFASSLLPRIPPLPFLSSRGKGTDRCLQILHFEYFIVSGQLGISFNTFRWSG